MGEQVPTAFASLCGPHLRCTALSMGSNTGYLVRGTAADRDFAGEGDGLVGRRDFI